MWADEVRDHLENKILPFWESLIDRKNGGYIGYVGRDLVRDPKAEKGCILNSRILWFFSSCYLVQKDASLLPYAEHAWQFLREHCYDEKNGGVFWSVTFEGKPGDTEKHTYNQAFAIYALSAYYRASGDREALDLAKELYRLVEGRMRDSLGYLEAFDREFRPASNEKLSENGVMAEKTMNTLLHVLEGYTGLYEAAQEEDVKKSLFWILDLFAAHVYQKELGRQEVFFDKNWNSLIDLYSYGHDIETSWLLDHTVEVLGDCTYQTKFAPITRTLAENIYTRAYEDHSVRNECERGKVDSTRVWWVQAESVVGLLNLWQKDRTQQKYRKAAEDIWSYIMHYLVDPREGSEWFWSLHVDHTPTDKPIVEPWKCPYHNGRMCLEILRRLQEES